MENGNSFLVDKDFSLKYENTLPPSLGNMNCKENNKKQRDKYSNSCKPH